MKKRRFFTLAMLSAAVIFATSCSKDDDDTPLAPSLTVTEINSGATGGSIEIEQGQSLIFAWESRKGDNNIKTFSISQSGSNVMNPINKTYNDHSIPYEVKSGDRSIYRDTIAFPNAGLNLGTTNYTFTSTDGTNSKSVSFNVTVVEATGETSPLSSAQDFSWERTGGGTGTGLSQFGLKWTNNTSSHAVVAVDGATMYKLNSSAWQNITTHEDLSDAISTATSITKYEGVSVTASNTYDDVLAVTYNNAMYLIHITKGTVSTSGQGTNVTISGEYKM